MEAAFAGGIAAGDQDGAGHEVTTHHLRRPRAMGILKLYKCADYQ